MDGDGTRRDGSVSIPIQPATGSGCIYPCSIHSSMTRFRDDYHSSPPTLQQATLTWYVSRA
jgi:hypothetical protein